MAEGSPVGALAVRIGADASQLISELGRADKSLGRHGESYAAASKAAAAFAATAVVAATAVAAMVKSSINNADEMFKAAQATGLATSAFSEYAYAAGQSGVSTEQLSVNLVKLNRGIVEAANFTGEASKAFVALGLNARNSDGSLKSVDQVMAEVANKFAQMEDGAGKTALAVLLFGRAGAQMIPMLNQGAVGLKEMREEARKLGVSIDSETGKAAEQFNYNLTSLSTVTRGYANQLMKELLPALNQITDAMVRGKKEGDGYHKEIKGLSDFLQDTGLATFQVVAVIFANLSFMAKTAGSEIGGMAAQITALATLDLEGFRAISKAIREDADKAKAELDAFEKKIMNVKKPFKDQPGGAMDMDDDPWGKRKKKPAPEIATGDNGLAKQIQDGVEEEEKMQAEAIAATVVFRDTQIATDKAAYDNRIKAMIEFYDLEQDMDIAQGQILVDSGGAHSSKVLELRRNLLSESAALENEAFAKQLEKLEDFSDAELDDLGGRQKIIEQLTQEHIERLDKIKNDELARDSARRRSGLQGAEQAMNDMAGLMNTSSRKVFEIGKAAAIGQAAYKGALAVMDAWEAGMSIGGPWAPLFAAGYAAAAAANSLNLINNIRSQSFGGGGGSPTPVGQGSSGVGTPAAAAPSSSSSSRGPDTFVHLHGETFGRKQIRALIEQLNEGGRDGGRIVLQ